MADDMNPELKRWREEGRAPAGSCPFCASRISVVERDGVFVARCSHRGCGARGPRHHDLTRACDLFFCPPPRTACGMTRAEADRGDALAARHEAEARAERAEAATASLRHAALFAAGVRGAPGAWRWASDPAGTTLSDESAWERLLGEMAAKCCVIGPRPCRKHGQVHGREAEELRAGIERLLASAYSVDVSPATLQELLDRVDARDSLAFLEAGGKTAPEPKPTEPEAPAWAMGYTDATGTVVVEYCERTFESKGDATEYLADDAPMGLWYWEGTIRAWQCREGDYDSEAVGKFMPTTARCVNLGEVHEAAPEPIVNVPDGETRKPVAVWENDGTGVMVMNVAGIHVRAAVGDWTTYFDDMNRSGRGVGDTSDAQLAAEDALFAIADAINALRGGK